MQFLKTLLWIVILVCLLVFAMNNWKQVSINLTGDIKVDTKLPALVIAAFLLGAIPTWLIYRATRWRLNCRIASLEADIRRREEVSANMLAEREADLQQLDALPDGGQ